MAEQTMIERAAKAHMERREGILPAGVPRIGGQPMRWEDLPPFAREHEINAMRAAIEAMREPTPKMLKAGADAIDEFLTDADGTEGYAWSAMIDAALAEGADTGEKAGITQAPSSART